jgi:hypothetical protein
MRPNPTNEALSAWLDGELDEAGIGDLEAELARDPDLREELEALEAVVRTLREEGPVAAPEGFEAGVMARIAAEAPEEAGWFGWLRRPFGIPLEGWALGLAAAAVLLLLLPRPPGDDETARELSPAAVEPPNLKGEAALVDPQPQQGEPAEIVGEPDLPEGVPEKGRGVDLGTKKVSSPAPVGTEAAEPAPLDPQGEPASKEAPPVGTPHPPEGTSSDAVALGPEPHQLVVRSGSASVKLDLLKVCGRYYWRCEAADGPTDGKMRASRETIVVSLPQSDLPLLVKELAGMGHDVQRIGDDGLMKGSTVRVPVVLQLVGGAGKSEPKPINAARSRAEHDSFESVEPAEEAEEAAE